MPPQSMRHIDKMRTPGWTETGMVCLQRWKSTKPTDLCLRGLRLLRKVIYSALKPMVSWEASVPTCASQICILSFNNVFPEFNYTAILALGITAAAPHHRAVFVMVLFKQMLVPMFSLTSIRMWEHYSLWNDVNLPFKFIFTTFSFYPLNNKRFFSRVDLPMYFSQAPRRRISRTSDSERRCSVSTHTHTLSYITIITSARVWSATADLAKFDKKRIHRSTKMGLYKK